MPAIRATLRANRLSEPFAGRDVILLVKTHVSNDLSAKNPEIRQMPADRFFRQIALGKKIGERPHFFKQLIPIQRSGHSGKSGHMSINVLMVIGPPVNVKFTAAIGVACRSLQRKPTDGFKAALPSDRSEAGVSVLRQGVSWVKSGSLFAHEFVFKRVIGRRGRMSPDAQVRGYFGVTISVIC